MDGGRAVEGCKASPPVCLATTVRESPTHRALGQEFGRRNRISNRNWPKNRTYGKQTTKPCLTETRIDTRHSEFSSHFVPQSRGFNAASAPFLTGSGSQTEIDVTHSKQTTEKFLTGARTHIKDFDFSHDSAPPTPTRLATLRSRRTTCSLEKDDFDAVPVRRDRSCWVEGRGREARGCARGNRVGSLRRADRSHLMQINKAARESEMLGTLALAAPKTSDFQFVKFRVDGEIARLTLDRPEHNLLNERVLMELVAGINSVSETSAVKLIVLDR